jgi:hypothetical protein
MEKRIRSSGPRDSQKSSSLATFCPFLCNPQVCTFGVERSCPNQNSQLIHWQGGGILAKGSRDNLKLGERLITIGLAIQFIFFGFFMVVSAAFHYRIALYPTVHCQTLIVPWKRSLHTLYIASTLIMARSVFRIVEYIQGSDGFLLKKEMYLYIFDASLMFLTMVVFNVFHPSKVISNRHASHAHGPSQDNYGMMMTDRGGYEHLKP